ncbi:MAG: nucleotidyl transferase AbiEii/AbiGii toxin family protein [Myxococcales bacterium]|nr:nucleotidyl transferase AbiEii/AbiGii toxin family protein [Myxococcales bacterium]
MTAPLSRPVTADGLFLWIMHRFAEAFEEHAVLKGGMALRLLDSPRATNDIDYVFVPFASKSDVRGDIERVLREIEGAEISIQAHSTMLRADVRVDGVAVQVEVSVATTCRSAAMATAGFAQSLGQPSHVVRVMSWDTALAHKLGAWCERRLLRDLYDGYFLFARLDERPDLAVLDARLADVRSRIPKLRKRKVMSRADLARELREAAATLDGAAIAEELAPLLPQAELAGLSLRLRSALIRLADWIEAAG